MAVAHKCGMSAAQQSTIKRTSTTTTRPTSNFQDGIERASPTNAIFIHSPWIPIPKARPGVNTQHRHSSSTTKTSRKTHHRRQNTRTKQATEVFYIREKEKVSFGGLVLVWLVFDVSRSVVRSFRSVVRFGRSRSL